MMKHFKVFVFFLLAMFIGTGSYAFASNPAQMIWWELEADKWDRTSLSKLSKEERIAAREKPKTLILRQGTFPLSGDDEGAPGQSLALDDASVWIRDPDGVVSEINPSSDNGTIALELPSDLNPGELNGRYLVGIHLDAGIMDIDSDGTDERVHLYSKILVNYRKQGGTKGENPDMFFRDDDKIALEIGPFITKSKVKKAGCPHAGVIKRSKDSKDSKDSKGSKVGYVSDGGSQSSLKEHKMKVFYEGQPLANAEVIILSKSGWKKTVMTDSEGAISITPPKTLARVADPRGISRSHGKPRSGIGEGTEKDRHGGGHKAGYGGEGKVERKARYGGEGKVERKVGHAGEGKVERKAGQADRIFRGNRRAAGDKLLYVVAYKDPSTGEYHCATLPMNLRPGMGFYRKWVSKASGFASWGIIGGGLGIVGLGGGVYHRKRRNRETIFKSKKS